MIVFGNPKDMASPKMETMVTAVKEGRRSQKAARPDRRIRDRSQVSASSRWTISKYLKNIIRLV